MSRKKITVNDLLAAGVRSLGPDEKWCISHTPEGPLAETASLNFTYPVVLFCQALDVEWDDAQEQGYRLAKMNMTTGQEVAW